MGAKTIVISIIFVTFAALIAGVVFYHQNDVGPTTSTFVLTPSPVLSPTKAPEPVVTSWTTYTNEKYNFTITYPDGWNQQEFTIPTGGTLVAFSPNTLPCPTCTYVHEGYYSVKVFNATTDPRAYTDYVAAKNALGKSTTVIPIQMGGIPGILYANTAAVENHGWIYAVNLDSNNGTDNPMHSQLFQKAASSLTFTYLIFQQ